jgi:hypothetical protein
MTNGGAEGDRTPDLSSAIAALSQLSYGPWKQAPFRDRPSGLSSEATPALTEDVTLALSIASPLDDAPSEEGLHGSID